MSETPTAAEVLNLGIEAELLGENLYGNIAAKATDQATKNLCAVLAAQERDHVRQLRELVDECDDSGDESRAMQEARKRLHSSFTQRVLPAARRMAGQIGHLHATPELYQVAIGLERDVIRFYQELRFVVPVGVRRTVDVILNTEHLHLTKLQRQVGEVT
ncbi:MAG: ferritin family protein [Armatimonadota bacterium]